MDKRMGWGYKYKSKLKRQNEESKKENDIFGLELYRYQGLNLYWNNSDEARVAEGTGGLDSLPFYLPPPVDHRHDNSPPQ
jgi:hypothetical protein